MQVRKTKIDEATLDKYTEELLLCLPEHASELMHELAKDYKLPIWQLFCGVVLEVHTQGNLSNFSMDPAWAEGLKQYDYACKHCQKKFKPFHLGQIFCSNECGEAHNAAINAITSAAVNIDTNDLSNRISALAKEVKAGWTGADQIPA
jgi:hypothetical protein